MRLAQELSRQVANFSIINKQFSCFNKTPGIYKLEKTKIAGNVVSC